MRASPRWVDGSFRNVHEMIPGLRGGEGMPLLEFFCPKEKRAPAAPLPTVDPLPLWKEPPTTGLRATPLGHSTLVIELGDARVLTDPVWGKRASPARAAGPKRFQPVPVGVDALPPIDAVLLSHDHYDHLDYPTIRLLARTSVPFIAPLGVGAHLEAWGVEARRITELDWWESCPIRGTQVRVTCAPAQHFSGRGPNSRNHTLWCSYVLEDADHRVFFGGDSGLTHEFRTIRERLGPFDLALLEIGAYHPSWGDIHLGPVHALQAWDWLGNCPLLPVHWGTFDLATHRWDQPIETLYERSAARVDRLLLPHFGEPTEPALERTWTPWWRGLSVG